MIFIQFDLSIPTRTLPESTIAEVALDSTGSAPAEIAKSRDPELLEAFDGAPSITSAPSVAKMTAKTNGLIDDGKPNGISRDLHASLQRWEKRLGALPSLALPTDYPRPCKSSS